ncbi:MAG: hypothetical protein IBJ03_15225 [Gemmatimonadaceae bacterium]|nr:hypothetical protein [Gemmatimonadaceae bacterium]
MKVPAFSRPLSRALVALSLSAFVAACGDDSPAGPETPLTECSTNITAATDGSFVELCQLSSPVRHVRIENAKAGPTHASAQVVFGFSAPPTVTSGAIADGQFRVLLYGGGTPAPTPQLQASFGAVDATFDDNATYINSGATVCFDLHDGSATSAPAFVMWVSGQRGADCANRSTLTAATAMGARTEWRQTTGAVAKQLKAYFRQAAGSGATPKITLSTTAVLDASAIAAATTCTTTWATNADWQSLCVPAAGAARHVRLNNVQSTANNSYFYAVFGQDPSPTGNPVASAGKLIITGGRSSSGSSWTWFRFGAGSTTQFSYATDAASALFTQAPNTVCFDMGPNANGRARLVFWATGAKGADCAVKSSLRLDRALYDSANDPTTAVIWDAAYLTGKLNFIKTNNTSVTLGAVVVTSEPAVL